MIELAQCRCSGPGHCPVYDRTMRRREWELCSGQCPDSRPCDDPEVRKGYATMWSGEGPAATKAWVRPKGHPGTELKKLLAMLGFTAKSGCKCNSKARQMDTWGVAGCRAHEDEIVAWLREEQKKAGWLEKAGAVRRAAANAMTFLNPLDPAGSLVREAIRRAERTIDPDLVAPPTLHLTDAKPKVGSRVVATAVIGPVGHARADVSLSSLKAYAARCRADFEAVEGDAVFAVGEKFRVRELFERYESVLFLDIDVLVRKDAPDLFDLVPAGQIGMHDDEPWLANKQWLRREADAVAKSQGLGPDILPATCLNTGVVVCRDARVYNPPIKPYPAYHCAEQHWLNWNIARLGIPVMRLPRRLSWLWLIDPEFQHADTSAILHFAKPRWATERDLLTQMKRFANTGDFD